jgi:hypothetical protein
LWEETVPFREGISRVSGGKDRDEVIFEGSDGPFGGIGAMFFGGDTLEVDFVFLKSILESLGTFIVENV